MNIPQHDIASGGALDPEEHPGALERASMAALLSGDLLSAFRTADRRCRILPVAQARHFTLRAEIAYRRGLFEAACADITRALELAPDDLAANRRMMQWGTELPRQAAAIRLLGLDHDVDVLATAIAVLKGTGRPGFGAIHRVGPRITGWVAWKGRARPRISIERNGKTKNLPIRSDPEHPLTQIAEHAASFDLPLPQTATRTIVRLVRRRQDIARQIFSSPAIAPKPIAESILAKFVMDSVTVVVPVYADFDATRRCLDSLIRALEIENTAAAVLVDDASPDERITALLESLSSHPKITLLRNSYNLGFIGAVNSALQKIPAGDVILLNADTVVPNDLVARLKAVAHSSSDIGTVTPFSNNGEATSLPSAFAANPLPDSEQIVRLDAVAASVNAGRIIDMPDGIGFCLYMTRACLDAIGSLSEHYHRGYLEDVDFCLRAREHGFRNVCATSVYVGHAGSVSFKAEKRALVVRNLEQLRLRFPFSQQESAAFKAIDPLQIGRAAIERALVPELKGSTAILTGPGAPHDVAVSFAHSCGSRALIATFTHGQLRLRDCGDGFPQSLRFQWPAQAAIVSQAAKEFGFSRIVVADPARIPIELARDFADNQAPMDLLVVDGGLWCTRGGLDTEARPCIFLTHQTACACASQKVPREWMTLLTPESRIIAPDNAAEAFLKKRLPAVFAKQIRVMDSSDFVRPAQRPPSVAPRGSTLGLLMAGHSPADFLLVQRLIRRVRQARSDTPVVVIGETLNDLTLMAIGHVTVTGAIDATELQQAAINYELGGLAIMRRAPLFGDPIVASAFRQVDVPLAFVDWSSGNVKVSETDLKIPPETDESSIIAKLLTWSDAW